MSSSVVNSSLLEVNVWRVEEPIVAKHKSQTKSYRRLCSSIPYKKGNIHDSGFFEEAKHSIMVFFCFCFYDGDYGERQGVTELIISAVYAREL